MKRWKSLLAVLAVGAILAGGIGSVAYFSSKDKTDNVFTVGAVDIKLEEPGWKADATHTITAEAKYEKDPTVENTGSNDAYVRVRVIVSDASAFKKANKDFACNAMFGMIGENWELQPEVNEDTTADTVEYTYCY